MNYAKTWYRYKAVIFGGIMFLMIVFYKIL